MEELFFHITVYLGCWAKSSHINYFSIDIRPKNMKNGENTHGDLFVRQSNIHMGFGVHASKILAIIEVIKIIKKKISLIRCVKNHTWGLNVPKPNSCCSRDLKNHGFHPIALSLILGTCVGWLHTWEGEKKKEKEKKN